jgi:hypothetical protein
LIWINAAGATHAAGSALHSPDQRIIGMSVTHPSEMFSVGRKAFLAGHDQLKPFLLAVAMFAAGVAIALAFTGLPQ